VARLNPLISEVEALRALILRGGSSVFGLGTDFAVLAGVFAVLVVVAGRLHGRMGSQVFARSGESAALRGAPGAN